MESKFGESRKIPRVIPKPGFMAMNWYGRCVQGFTSGFTGYPPHPALTGAGPRRYMSRVWRW